jgi:hypothetical protein
MGKATRILEELENSEVSEKISEQNWILDGIQLDELITTVQSNYKTFDEASVKKAWRELKRKAISEADYVLNKNMKDIIAMGKPKNLKPYGYQ